MAVCYAIGPLVAARKLSELPSLGLTAACLAFAAIVYAPIAAITWPSAAPAAKVIAALCTLAVVCTAIAFLVFFALIAEVGPARASVITYINPAVAVALGIGVLGEHLTLTMAVAFVAILGGSVLATRTGSKAVLSDTAAPIARRRPGRADGRHGLSERAVRAARLDSRG